MAADARKLSEQEIQEALEELAGWSVDEGKLHKTFTFQNFSQAFGWMASVALEAQKMDHHPDWCNSWNKVEVHLVTHSIGALSQYDLKLARKMEELA